MSWLFSRALVEEYSEAVSLDGEQCAPWNENLTPQVYCSLDKTTDCSRLSRFGMTYAPLTDTRGADVLTWFLRASRARTSAPQEKARALRASGQGSGERLSGSWVRYDPATSSWRTAQCSLDGDSEEFSGTWPRWGLMLDGECWELDMSGLPTSENESGFLPTLTHRDYRSDKCTPEVKAKRDAHPRGKTLPWVLGGLVNPQWAEWFMGWPEGWTESKPLGTDRFQEWLQQHGESLEVSDGQPS